jgi:hypothetical protein
MATKVNTPASAASAFKKADGFVNFTVIAKDGSRHTFKSGIPLYKGRMLDDRLMVDPKILTTLLSEGRVEASIHLVAESSDKLDL